MAKGSLLKPKFSSHKDLHSWANSAWGDWRQAFKENFDRATTCSKFLFGISEWDQAVVASRDIQDKETISANFCNKFYKQLKSELLEVNVTLDIAAQTDIRDEEDLLDAEIIEQIILSSDNLSGFQKAIDDCLVHGFGVVEVIRAFEDRESLNQVLKVRPIRNLQDCFFDITSSDPTFAKSRMCGYKTSMSLSTLSLNYPKLDSSKYNHRSSKLVDVWDFYWKEAYQEIFYEYDRNKPAVTISQLNPEMVPKRHSFKKIKRMLPMVCRARFTKEEFLIKPEVLYKGDYMPMVYWPVMTSKYFEPDNRSGQSAGQFVTTPYIFHFLGLQQAYNYVLSQATTLVAQATGRKYFLTRDQASADLEKWSSINSQSGSIFYSREQEPVASGQQNNQQVQIQVDSTEPLQPTLLNMLQLLQNTFNDLSGSYASQQGAPDNTVSGAAADIKVSQSSLTNRQIINAHVKTIDTVGSILQQWIPQVYKERRIFRLATGKLLAINDRKYDQMRGLVIKNDINDLMSVLRVRVGAGISTRQERKNAMQSLINIMSTTQNSLAVLGPVLAMNWEGDGKDVLEKLLLTLLSKEQYELLRGRITEDQFFEAQAQAASQQKDPTAELNQQKLQQQIANIAANTETAKARAQKATMDVAYVEKQIKEPMGVEKTQEYADLAKEKQIAQISELKTREKMTLAKLLEKTDFRKRD